MTEPVENSKSYEELFASRFTPDDHEYEKYLNRPADPPPIVEEWRGRSGGNQRGRDNRYQDRRGWGGDRGWRGGHHGQQHWHNRDRDHHSGHGSGYRSGYSGSNQAYNSNYQRPHYDRY